MSKWIKSGLAVVNITNLEKIMSVVKVVYRSKKITDGDEGPRSISRIVGVECKLTDSDGNEITTMNHSKELIPLSVVVKGKLEAFKFINREGEYKDY